MPARVRTSEFVRELALRLEIPPAEAERYLVGVGETLRSYLRTGSEVELGDLFALTVSGGPEIREDESGGFSAYAPAERGIHARPVGALKDELDRSCRSAIYYVATKGDGHFVELLGDYFGRRGWQLVRTKNGMEVQSRLERVPPVAVVFESHAEGWPELVRELKCDPKTNWVPVVGVFPQGALDAALPRLTVQPDDIIYEPFDFTEFIATAGSGLAARVTAPQHDVVELEMHLPGGERDRREARESVEEVLFRCGLPEKFSQDAGGALAEALDNALRHGHQFVACCTIHVRMILDPKRLVLAVRDTGDGFDSAAALAAARGRRGKSKSDPLAKAAAALRTRHGDAREGGIAKMMTLVDRVDYNKIGNEVVLTKRRPTST